MTHSAQRHGGDLKQAGFTVGQVVHGYGDVCQAVTELAMELESPISADEFKTLNRCLDEAIAQAVTEFARQRDLSGRTAAPSAWASSPTSSGTCCPTPCSPSRS